jgi:hypothetical protein
MQTTAVQRIALTRPVVEPSERGAVALADAYWDEIRRLTLGLVSARRENGGVRLAIAGLVTLFRFGPPKTVADAERVECRFPITGGLLAKHAGGSLSFTQRSTPTPELIVTVEDYVPRLSPGRERRSLRRFVYTQVQERAHAGISRRYLERMGGDRP